MAAIAALQSRVALARHVRAGRTSVRVNAAARPTW